MQIVVMTSSSDDGDGYCVVVDQIPADPSKLRSGRRYGPYSTEADAERVASSMRAQINKKLERTGAVSMNDEIDAFNVADLRQRRAG